MLGMLTPVPLNLRRTRESIPLGRRHDSCVVCQRVVGGGACGHAGGRHANLSAGCVDADACLLLVRCCCDHCCTFDLSNSQATSPSCCIAISSVLPASRCASPCCLLLLDGPPLAPMPAACPTPPACRHAGCAPLAGHPHPCRCSWLAASTHLDSDFAVALVPLKGRELLLHALPLHQRLHHLGRSCPLGLAATDVGRGKKGFRLRPVLHISPPSLRFHPHPLTTMHVCRFFTWGTPY